MPVGDLNFNSASSLRDALNSKETTVKMGKNGQGVVVMVVGEEQITTTIKKIREHAVMLGTKNADDNKAARTCLGLVDIKHLEMKKLLKDSSPLTKFLHWIRTLFQTYHRIDSVEAHKKLAGEEAKKAVEDLKTMATKELSTEEKTQDFANALVKNGKVQKDVYTAFALLSAKHPKEAHALLESILKNEDIKKDVKVALSVFVPKLREQVAELKVKEKENDGDKNENDLGQEGNNQGGLDREPRDLNRDANKEEGNRGQQGPQVGLQGNNVVPPVPPVPQVPQVPSTPQKPFQKIYNLLDEFCILGNEKIPLPNSGESEEKICEIIHDNLWNLNLDYESKVNFKLMSVGEKIAFIYAILTPDFNPDRYDIIHTNDGNVIVRIKAVEENTPKDLDVIMNDIGTDKPAGSELGSQVPQPNKEESNQGFFEKVGQEINSALNWIANYLGTNDESKVDNTSDDQKLSSHVNKIEIIEEPVQPESPSFSQSINALLEQNCILGDEKFSLPEGVSEEEIYETLVDNFGKLKLNDKVNFKAMYIDEILAFKEAMLTPNFDADLFEVRYLEGGAIVLIKAPKEVAKDDISMIPDDSNVLNGQEKLNQQKPLINPDLFKKDEIIAEPVISVDPEITKERKIIENLMNFYMTPEPTILGQLQGVDENLTLEQLQQRRAIMLKNFHETKKTNGFFGGQVKKIQSTSLLNNLGKEFIKDLTGKGRESMKGRPIFNDVSVKEVVNGQEVSVEYRKLTGYRVNG